jgi:glycerophosphoryl diester phosphodiesterase
VVLTSDQEIVACHDPLLEISTADRSGWAHEHTLRELTRAHLLDARGEPSDETLMSLRELITATPADLAVQLDVKAYADPGLAARAAQRCCEIARELGARERVEIISFFSAACGVATERGFEARLTVWADYDPRALARWAIDHGASGLALEGFILGPQLHKAIREAGLGLSVGVVNSVDQLLRILPFEPEIIVSDCPHEVGAALAEIGEASAEGA